MSTLAGKTLFITGSSRGIGLAIALRAARDGANIVVTGKTTEPNPRLPGTIYTAAKEIEAAGGHALPIALDIRFDDQVHASVEQTVRQFGGIDILVNNASAISLTGTLQTPMKRYDLMMGINVRGTYLCSQACLPHLAKAPNPHILSLSPPLDLRAKWFAPHLAYSMSTIRHELVRAGHGGRIPPAGNRRECAVAAHHRRHRRAAVDPWRRAAARAHSGNRSRRCLAHTHSRQQKHDRQFLY